MNPLHLSFNDLYSPLDNLVRPAYDYKIGIPSIYVFNFGVSKQTYKTVLVLVIMMTSSNANIFRLSGPLCIFGARSLSSLYSKYANLVTKRHTNEYTHIVMIFQICFRNDELESMFLIRVNSSRLSGAYMRQLTEPSLVQIMFCHLSGAKPLSEQVLVYCWLGPWEQHSVKLKSKFLHFHYRKCVSKILSPK